MQYLLLVVILFFSGCCNGQVSEIKSDGVSMEQNESYFIDGEKVNKVDFEKFIKKFQRIDGKTKSIETPEGGRTSYELKDSNGLVYEYISESKQGNVFINSLKEKH